MSRRTQARNRLLHGSRERRLNFEKTAMGRFATGIVKVWLLLLYNTSSIRAVLDHVRSAHSGNVLLVSSGGVISSAIGDLLDTPPAARIELNMRLRNSAVSEFVFTPKRHALQSFNTLPHLDPASQAALITYA